jgi:hypothetical protein
MRLIDKKCEIRRVSTYERSLILNFRTDSQSIPLPKQQSWYEEFGEPARFQRIPLEAITKAIKDRQEPQIFLRGSNGKTDIIFRLPMTTSVVPRKKKRAYSRHGVTLAEAFDEILWQKLEKNKSTIWAEIAGLMTKAYRQAWLQWFRLQYLSHSHPVAESGFKKLTQEIESVVEVTRRGRRSSTEAELASLRRRYDKLLLKCELIHRGAEHAAKSLAGHNLELSRKGIRIAIWKRVRRSVHGMPGDAYIFDGTAFKRIRGGTAKLHDPETWKPHQLAIALVSLERQQAYQTIEKKVVPTKRNSKGV